MGSSPTPGLMTDVQIINTVLNALSIILLLVIVEWFKHALDYLRVQNQDLRAKLEHQEELAETRRQKIIVLENLQRGNYHHP